MESRKINYLMKELRKASGLKQSHIAELLNVERSSISKIESGVPALSKEVIRKIASVFKINPDFIDGKTNNAFLPESFLKLKIRHYVDIFGGSSMLLPFMLMINTNTISFVLLLNKFKVEYILAKDELDSIFVMEIIFNLKLDEARRRILNGANISKSKIAIRALPISPALSAKLDNMDTLEKEDVISCFDQEKKEYSDSEKMLIDLVRNKVSIKDISLFLKGMGLK